jgi:hypothetical protein
MSLSESLDNISNAWKRHKYPVHVKVEKLEIVHNCSNHPVWREEEISLTNRHALTEWLKEDDENAFSGARGLSLKLLFICTQDPERKDAEADEEDANSIAEVFRAAGLPLTALAAYSNIIPTSTPFTYLRRENTTSLLSRYYFGFHSYCVTWAFDHSTKNTRAIFIYRNEGIGLQFRIEFAKALTSTARYVDQPMLLGLAGTKLFLESAGARQLHDIVELESISQSTGLFNWDPKTGDIVEVDTSGLDYGRISRRLASISGRANQYQFMLSITQSSATSMLQEHNKSSQEPASQAGDGNLTKSEEVKEALQIVKTHTEAVLKRNQWMREDLANMMSAIYNLIAQKDSNVGLRLANHSRTLAIESKRDSSSMKTIAAVTMAFLPGTFVSSFFAMPMFDRNKPPGDNVNTRTFWIYWTVTIPLTFSVFLVWWAWFRFKTARETKEDKLLAEIEKLEEKRNAGISDPDSQSDARTHSQNSLYSPPPETSETIWRRLRSTTTIHVPPMAMKSREARPKGQSLA